MDDERVEEIKQQMMEELEEYLERTPFLISRDDVKKRLKEMMVAFVAQEFNVRKDQVEVTHFRTEDLEDGLILAQALMRVEGGIPFEFEFCNN